MATLTSGTSRFMHSSSQDSPSSATTTSPNPHPFLRFNILTFQIHNNHTTDLKTVITQVELKEKQRTAKHNHETPARIKLPLYNEKDRCIPFDAGLLPKIKRQIIIRISSNNIIYTYESDLGALKKLADGHRHRFYFTPRAEAEMIIKYKDASGRTVRETRHSQTVSRYAERRQQIYTHYGHEFVPKLFKLPTFCSVCGEFLWGFAYPGYQCQRCDCVVHKSCYKTYACPCSGRKYSNLNVRHADHHFAQLPFSLKPFFCDHCGSFIRPGHAQRCSDCAMTLHRRCTSKVGSYCGCEQNVLDFYEEWKQTHDNDLKEEDVYNNDLYKIYSTIGQVNQQQAAQNVVERFSTRYRPEVTSGFHVSHFRFIRTLGQGMNGSVYLVQYSRNYYAMKVLRKNLVLEGQDLPYVMLEREIMIQSRSNPFIIQLMYAFQDAQRLYFVMEVAKGGNFYRLLIKQAPKPFPYERIVFHSGEIACALAFLHSKRIAYRDLKPENVLVFDDGHIKLGDFGLCRKDIDQHPRATTFCGTQEYIAYEIYKHCEYDENVDWWSLGIMIYELFTFVTPFYDEDEMQIEENVLSKDVYYPETMPNEAKTIIAAFLERDPRKRLGNKYSLHGHIGDQLFFSPPYTLQNIENKRVPPPWKPSVLTSFEPSSEESRLSELEEKDKILLLSTPPETFRGFSYVCPNIVTSF